ncbi:MAG: ribonuclease HII [bacterium]|nr:ribonuclease HII [bacterium]
MSCSDVYEKQLLSRHYNYICGVDEVGRGAIFGPVVAGAVILDPHKPSHGIDDSKKLTPRKRSRMARFIYANALAYSIGWCWNDEIDRSNILLATKKAMKMAVQGLQIKPDYVLMDGMKPDFIDIQGQGIVKGDGKSISIAAASIIAKVFRDELISSFAPFFPQYGIDQNKGYATPKHIEAVLLNGFSRFHRKSFKIGKS